ncbi:MAG: sarcosine oxidase subunit delta, partial [Gammaproteobacteria bacterium]|nr:sarcosine oxidase subunit delta [Gammaproteobacteria bacterium]
LDPNACTDEEWGEYLFFRDNPRGIHHELWIHAAGCRQYFNVTRHTVSYAILETYKIGEQPSVTEASLASKKAAEQGVKA